MCYRIIWGRHCPPSPWIHHCNDVCLGLHLAFFQHSGCDEITDAIRCIPSAFSFNILSSVILHTQMAKGKYMLQPFEESLPACRRSGEHNPFLPQTLLTAGHTMLFKVEKNLTKQDKCSRSHKNGIRSPFYCGITHRCRTLSMMQRPVTRRPYLPLPLPPLPSRCRPPRPPVKKNRSKNKILLPMNSDAGMPPIDQS